MKALKVLLLNGSPHEKGCVFTALKEVAEAIHEPGIETEIFWIGNQPVRDCIACGGCSAPEAKGCVFQDDILPAFVQKMSEADALIVGTPVYYAGPAGSLCSLLDRAFFSAKAAFARKPAACVVNCRRGGASSAFDRLNKFFTISQMPVVSSQYWNDTHGCSPEELQQDEEGLQTMRTLGQNMVHLLLSQAEAKLPPPETEPKITTNFIRNSVPAEKIDQPKPKNSISSQMSELTAAFFREKGYDMIDSAKPEDNDEKTNPNEYDIAKKFWNSYPKVNGLFKHLYDSQENSEYSFDSECKPNVLTLCNALKKYNWLTFEVTDTKNTTTIKLQQINAPKHRPFYNGRWAEMVILYLIRKTLHNCQQKYNISCPFKIFQNLELKKIESENGKGSKMELDIVFAWGKQVYIFEVKSGKVLGVDKWLEQGKRFGKNNFILCCTDEQLDPKHFAPYKLFTLQNFEEQLEKRLLKDFSAVNAEKNIQA